MPVMPIDKEMFSEKHIIWLVVYELFTHFISKNKNINT